MFNWVCPQCGKDVPPSKTECPFCAERAREMAAAGVPPPAYGPQGQPLVPQGPAGQPAWPQPPQPPAPQGWQPQPPPGPAPQQYYPAQEPPPQRPQAPVPIGFTTAQPPPGWPSPSPQYAQHPGQQPGQHPSQPAWPPQQRRQPPPTWLMVIAFALAFLGIGAAVYFGIQRFGKTNPAEKAGLENPANPSQQKVSNPLQKYVEVVGIRMVTENKKPVAKFVVVNHSNAEISDLAANVTLWASTSRSEEDSVGSFSFKVRSLGANASEEMTEPLKTKLKIYELPDWQNATAEIQITNP